MTIRGRGRVQARWKVPNALPIRHPSAIESVASLLYTGRNAPVSGTHPQTPNGAAAKDETLQVLSTGYDYMPCNLLG